MEVRITRRGNGKFYVECREYILCNIMRWKRIEEYQTLPEAHRALITYIDKQLGELQYEEVYAVQIEPFKDLK